jgi:hypothetical protein
VRRAEAVDQMDEQGGKPGEAEQKSNEEKIHGVPLRGQESCCGA